jgi:hypothetical protein
MILDGLEITADELARRTGWVVKPEGACKADRCVPLPDFDEGRIDARVLAERLRMPLIRDEVHDLWCLGPESDSSPLESTRAPELNLPDWRGREFSLASLRGMKVLLLAWASW